MVDEQRPSSAEEAFEQFIALKGSNEKTSFEEWVRRYPEFEAELRLLVRDWEKFEEELDQAFRESSKDASYFRRDKQRVAVEAPTDSASTPFRPGARVGDFRLIRLIAQGGMGQVWEAMQLSLQRPVALKFIRPDRITPRSLSLFEREARAGGRLSHPGIVTIYDTGESKGLRWIAQELVPGGDTFHDFLQEITKEGVLPNGYYRRLVEFFVELTDALQKAHDANVVHRDLKPQNILITPDDHPKVTDFGLAILVDEKSLSGPLSFVGTIQYMSPEQVAAKSMGIDSQTDVFSLGTILYEAMALRPPFEGESQFEVCAKILHGDPLDPRKVRSNVPRDLAVITLKALEKERSRRYSSMRELGDELRRYLNDEPIKAQPPGAVMRAYKYTRRHPTTTAVFGLGLLLAAAAWGIYVARGKANDRQFNLHLTQAQWDIEMGKLEDAQEQIERANAIRPSDPTGHMILAAGYAKVLAFKDSERELQRAIAKGFDPVRRDDMSPTEEFLLALSIITEEKRPGFVEAEKLLAAAVARDESLTGAWFPLYQVRKALEDFDRAEDALRAYRRTIREMDDIYPSIDALLAELDGDHEAAIAHLDELANRPGIDQERLEELRVHRIYGRNYMLMGELGAAEENLRQAVEVYPDDGSAWANLANVYRLRSRTAEGVEQGSQALAHVSEYALRAAEIDPAMPAAADLLAWHALQVLERDPVLDPDDSVWEETARLLEDLRKQAPDGTYYSYGIARLHSLQARAAESAERSAEAVELWNRALESDPDDLESLVHLAQNHWFEDEFDLALEKLERALVQWNEPDPRRSRPWPRRWIFAIHAWRYGSAIFLGDAETARAARNSMDTELADGSSAQLEELLTYAEFLTYDRLPEFEDCERAWEVVQEFDLRGRVLSLPAGKREGAQEILRLMESKCP